MASTSSSHQQNALFRIGAPNTIWRESEGSSKVFDVFINHRGPDVKKNLATELYNSLKERKIRVFLDSEEKELGNSFISTIETAIRSASVHIAIFSKRYAESDWCLRELVLMLKSNAKIIPVFYQVEPWELRHIKTGVYAEAFTKHEIRYGYKSSEEWKEALQQISFTAGYELQNSDSSVCKAIVRAVQIEIQRRKSLHVAKYPVGLDKLVEDLERQCLNEFVQYFESQCGTKQPGKEKANVVGIFGTGGVGKTTLSKELFNQKRLKYKTRSFIYDVRKAHAHGKLTSLQSQLLDKIFCESNLSFQSTKEGADYLRDCLERNSSLSFLIVLDDVDHVEQLYALLPMETLNKHGDNNHLVIITTRDAGVLVSAGIDNRYHVKGLNRKDGKELFCWHAFNRPCIPSSDYKMLVNSSVDACGALPESLVRLARRVSGRSVEEWKEELEKVCGDVKKSLRISFDGEDNEEKQNEIDSCDKQPSIKDAEGCVELCDSRELLRIAGTEETSEKVGLCCCINAVIQQCIQKFKVMIMV